MGWCGPQRSGKLDGQNEESAEMGEAGRGSLGLSLGSIINPISPGAAEGDLVDLPVPV